MSRKLVCQIGDMPADGMKAFDLDASMGVLILRSNENIYACQSLCPHQAVCLEDGLFDGEILTCHQHLWQWKIETGEPIGLAEAPLETYEVEIENGEIYIKNRSCV